MATTQGKPLGVVVVGYGFMGSTHARTVAGLSDASLRGVVDLNADRLNLAERELAVPTATSLAPFLDSPDCDAVMVCTPDHLHSEPAVLAAEAGRHVFVEKPLATSLEDCDAIISAAERANVWLAVGHILRFDPRYLEVKRAVESGELGRTLHLHLCRHDYRASGLRYRGAGFDLAQYLPVHDLDVLQWIAGSPIEAVQAGGHEAVLGDGPGYDLITALVTLQNGTTATLSWSWILPDALPSPHAGLEVHGSNGFARFLVDSASPVVVSQTQRKPEVFYNVVTHGVASGVLRAEVEHFVRLCRNELQPAILPSEARAAVQATAALGAALSKARA